MQLVNWIHGGGKHMKLKSLGLVVLLGLLAGCADVDPSLPTPDGESMEGKATVESVEVIMLTSFPLQVHLHVSGYVSDPCTEIDEIQTKRDGYAFEVLIKTKRDANLECIQVIDPFEENIPLDVYGLPAGDYQVVVNGVKAEFTFFQDNILGE
jgi:inhibitor of cysteine peptidase